MDTNTTGIDYREIRIDAHQWREGSRFEARTTKPRYGRAVAEILDHCTGDVILTYEGDDLDTLHRAACGVARSLDAVGQCAGAFGPRPGLERTP